MANKVLLAALAASAAVGIATPVIANHSWGNYHWARTSSTLNLTVLDAVNSTWQPYFDRAVSTTDWDNRSVLNLTSAGAPAGTSAKRCSPVTGKILVCNDSYGQRGWLGIASINIDSNSHITSGTTKLNDSYFNSATYNTPAWRRLVTCQEVGHDFGLAHQDETFGNVNLGSCMDYTNAPAGGIVGGFNYGPSNQDPNNHDTEQLNTIYNHLDSYSTNMAATNFGVRQVGKPAAGALPDPGDTAREWGTPIHRDGKGRPDMFVRPLADGGKMLTHVFWAPDAKGNEAV